LDADLEKRIVLSDRSHLILDYHKSLDIAREAKKAGKLGTTKRGIGPAYEDRASRRGIRMADLLEESCFEQKLSENLEEKNFLLKNYFQVEPVVIPEFKEKYRKIREQIRPFVGDVALLLHNEIQNGKKILYEGAQGVLLDLDYGTYPYVTSSHTLPSQAAIGLGCRMPKDTLFLGIVKAYATRVGEGPFPTELKDAMGEKLRQQGREFGATTGRPRRCGWLDLVAIRYAIQVSGIKNLAITKADVLSGMGEVKVCTSYSYKGKKLDTYPAFTSILDNVEPNYITLQGWSENLDTVKTAQGIPKKLLAYLQFIEKETGAKINLVSTGAGREAVIDIHDAF
jgi:adenylosuccinate synthase